MGTHPALLFLASKTTFIVPTSSTSYVCLSAFKTCIPSHLILSPVTTSPKPIPNSLADDISCSKDLPHHISGINLAATMGWWGSNLFQSDQDHDLLGDFAAQAGVELYFFEKDADKATAAKALDDGTLNALFDATTAEPSSDCDSVPATYKLVVLAALAMQLGVRSTRRNAGMSRVYKCTGQLMGEP